MTSPTAFLNRPTHHREIVGTGKESSRLEDCA